MSNEKILTKTITNGSNTCDYRLVKYLIDGNWTRPLLEYNQGKGSNGDWDEWAMTELFEHFSHGDIAHMTEQFGMSFGIGCYDEELIQTDELVEFKEEVTND